MCVCQRLIVEKTKKRTEYFYPLFFIFLINLFNMSNSIFHFWLVYFWITTNGQATLYLLVFASSEIKKEKEKRIL